MKGRTQFTRSEAERIRRLLRFKSNATGHKQRPFRKELRDDLEFYIERFGASEGAFTVDDFDTLVRIGKITIVEDE